MHGGLNASRRPLSSKIGTNVTISFRRRARAASRLAGLFASRLSALFLPRLRSSWIMVFFAYILSISLQEPPLEFSKPLRLFGSGGRPSMQAIPPAVPFADFPFIVWWVTNGRAVGIYTQSDGSDRKQTTITEKTRAPPAPTHRATAAELSAQGG